MTEKPELAVSKFMEGYNCAQSVFYSFCDELSIDKDTGLKLACGFGAGMGRKEEVCGAVSGGILAIGAKYGRDGKNDATATETTYKKTRELMNEFTDKKGSYICRKLLNGCDLTTEEGHRQFKENDYRKNICTPCVRTAVEILEKLM